jgi:hypothetical protein
MFVWVENLSTKNLKIFLHFTQIILTPESDKTQHFFALCTLGGHHKRFSLKIECFLLFASIKQRLKEENSLVRFYLKFNNFCFTY